MIPSKVARTLGVMLALAAAVTSGGCAHLVMLHDPLSATEHNDLGVAYEANGQRELAAREYRRSLKLDPRNARTRVNLGNVEAADGQWRAAEKCYRRALADSAEDLDAMNNLAVALLMQKRKLDEARRLAAGAVSGATALGDRDSLYRVTLSEVSSRTR